MKFYFTARSTNRKTGPMPVVTATKDTCPDTCTLKNNGCYAEHGHLGMFWARMNRGEISLLSFDELLTRIRALPKKQIWRYGQAGDLPRRKSDVIRLAKANRGRPAIVFTHGRDFETYKEAGELGLHINVSADSLAEADTLASTGLSVVAVIPSTYHRHNDESVTEFRTRLGGKLALRTPAGRKVAICPQTYTGITCAQCGLCAKPRPNGVIIGFPAHGVRKKIIDAALGGSSGANHDNRGPADLRSG